MSVNEESSINMSDTVGFSTMCPLTINGQYECHL